MAFATISVCGLDFALTLVRHL